METLSEWLKKNQIVEVECVIPDITGNARGKIIPAGKFIKKKAGCLNLYSSRVLQARAPSYTTNLLAPWMPICIWCQTRVPSAKFRG